MSDESARKTYVSGPMTGYENMNYALFNEAATLLRARGFEVLNPAEYFDGDQTLPIATYLRKDIASILEVDFLVMLQGWEGSKGACLEASVATGIGIPVYRFEDIRDETHAPPLHLVLSTALFGTPPDAEEPLPQLQETPPALPQEPRSVATVVAAPPPAPEQPKESILQEAERLVYGDRQQSYAHPLPDMTRTGKLWAPLLGLEEVSAEQVALCMIALKLSRLCENYKRDSLVDVAGYALCIQRMQDRRNGVGD